jgi:hypothetical protein
VHIRRALLLFAIVLVLAAVAASVSQTPDESGEGEDPPAAERGTPETSDPTLSPGTAASGGVRELVFDAERVQTRRVDAGQPATLLVEVDEPGLVEIPALGLSAPAQPLTPARFEVLISDPDRLAITFTPVEGDTPEPAGLLVVRDTAEG